jgi:hypothetical protein
VTLQKKATAKNKHSACSHENVCASMGHKKGEHLQRVKSANNKCVGELLARRRLRRRTAIQSAAVDSQFQIKVIQCLHCSHDQKKCHRTSTLIRFLWLFKAVLP